MAIGSYSASKPATIASVSDLRDSCRTIGQSGRPDFPRIGKHSTLTQSRVLWIYSDARGSTCLWRIDTAALRTRGLMPVTCV